METMRRGLVVVRQFASYMGRLFFAVLAEAEEPGNSSS